MAKIEIPIEEYQGMTDKIKALEDSVAAFKNEAELYKGKFLTLQSQLEDISLSGVIDRLFNWKNLMKSITSEL